MKAGAYHFVDKEQSLSFCIPLNLYSSQPMSFSVGLVFNLQSLEHLQRLTRLFHNLVSNLVSNLIMAHHEPIRMKYPLLKLQPLHLLRQVCSSTFLHEPLQAMPAEIRGSFLLVASHRAASNWWYREDLELLLVLQSSRSFLVPSCKLGAGGWCTGVSGRIALGLAVDFGSAFDTAETFWYLFALSSSPLFLTGLVVHRHLEFALLIVYAPFVSSSRHSHL